MVEAQDGSLVVEGVRDAESAWAPLMEGCPGLAELGAYRGGAGFGRLVEPEVRGQRQGEV